MGRVVLQKSEGSCCELKACAVVAGVEGELVIGAGVPPVMKAAVR